MILATEFFDSSNFKTADSIFIWKVDTITGVASDDSYFLGGVASQSGLTRWSKVGDESIFSRDAAALLLGNRSHFICSVNALPAYTRPAPSST